MSTATLSAHKTGYKCSEDEVRNAIAPKGTDSWKPISHDTLLNLVNDELTARELIVEGRDYAMARNGAQMFSVFNLRSEVNKDFTLALGLRNSTDKSLCAGLCAGSRVFVCDNLAFNAEFVLGRKHTVNIMNDLPALITSAFNNFRVASENQEKLFNHWKETEVPVEKASDFIVRLAGAGHIPSHTILDIRKEFLTPRFADFNGRTAWSLYNGATTVLRHDRKEINPISNADDLLGIHSMMEAEFSLN